MRLEAVQDVNHLVVTRSTQPVIAGFRPTFRRAAGSDTLISELTSCSNPEAMPVVESPLVAPYDQSLVTPKRLEPIRVHSTVSVVSSVDRDDCASVQWRPSNLGTLKEDPRRQLTVLGIVGLCYFSVCGGPIGSEPIISAGGPLIGLILLLLFPIILGLPIAYVTAELSTAYPEDGGYTVWVLNAFGPFWGFQTGYWAWISGVIDNALYPGLAVSTFTEVYGDIGSPTAEYFIKAAIAVALTLPNLLGIRIVGNGMVVLSIFVMIPFIVLFVWGLVSGHDWNALGEMRRTDIVYDSNGDLVSMTGSLDIDWSTLINTLFWNFNGAVGMSVFGGEVSNPGQTYPRAMLISVLLIALTYLMPLFGAIVFNSPNWTTWEDGSFSSIASALGGTFLSTWIMLASFASNAGMYIAELFCDSFQIMGMAQNDLAPAILKARNKRFNTPHNAVFASLIVILILIEFDFDDIVNMTNALSAFYQILIFAAFIKLRYTHADLKRPYKVPGSIPMLLLGLLIPTALLAYIAVDVFFTLAPAMIVLGVTLLGFVYARWKRFSRVQFEDLHLDG